MFDSGNSGVYCVRFRQFESYCVSIQAIRELLRSIQAFGGWKLKNGLDYFHHTTFAQGDRRSHNGIAFLMREFPDSYQMHSAYFPHDHFFFYSNICYRQHFKGYKRAPRSLRTISFFTSLSVFLGERWSGITGGKLLETTKIAASN